METKKWHVGQGEQWAKTHNRNYSVSNFGNVRNDKTNRILKPNLNNRYLKVSLGCKEKTASIHRLVAFAFIDNIENSPCVNHIDGNKLNNHVNNLEWCTVKQNAIHRHHVLNSGIGENHYLAKLKNTTVIDIVKAVKDGQNIKDVAIKFNTSVNVVRDVLRGKSWSFITGIKAKTLNNL